ncbi:methyl-accepting chemotaxis protein [Vibrio sp. 10N.261.55.A7]|uniref:methyl-accepting chemotaxis protein n=1 Tax=Vibrio sp. 10N.261.55.A7 TaxID=1880851 RepID=UPI000C8431B2|nr:methyl-accepting chemotaxis protein [Vibrio sp. 10N.261.55.A7]PMJ92117.1 chemotaxis protein [Vibrio sp. 10N.261.55.A7]
MNNKRNKSPSISLVQTINVVFIIILLLISLFSFTSFKSVERVGSEFSVLSDEALPLAINNANLTQTILEQVKRLSYATQVTTLEQLQHDQIGIEELIAESNLLVGEVSQRFASLTTEGTTPSTDSKDNQLESDAVSLPSLIQQLNSVTFEVLNSQRGLLEQQAVIDKQVPSFRYGLSSLGPEMNRIASFLSTDNPLSADAANRFISSASALESFFLLLVMQKDMEKAKDEYQELRYRLSSINLAYDEFKDWHPDIVEFASLITSYEMVKEGFEANGILPNVLKRLELVHEQTALVEQVTMLANQTIENLDANSQAAMILIEQRENAVNTTISNTFYLLILIGSIIALVIVGFGIGIRGWLNRSLKNVKQHLTLMADHDLSSSVPMVGPFEFQEVARKLNQVIDSTKESISVVTRNCETLYQTAEISYDAAESSSKTLIKQNESLANMVTTVTELEASIKEISNITSESFKDSRHASEQSNRGLKAVDQNRQRLEKLEQTLDINESAMVELDHRVKQIQEMVELISGIADNTNLLALNAAIEAARAGEQGRGFAVVADEVRQLASGTSQQTENIRIKMNQLIAAAQKSREAVEESRREMVSALASSEEVKSTFGDIESAVNDIQARVEQVTIATEEQERATSDVSESISNISLQGEETKYQLNSMVESSEQVAEIAGHQQAMLHKYVL